VLPWANSHIQSKFTGYPFILGKKVSQRKKKEEEEEEKERLKSKTHTGKPLLQYCRS
jgi:hypothetical protein